MMRARGFTLIELLVTIAVAVILATIAVPGFQRMMAVNRMAADYNEVLSGLNFARGEAIKRRAEVKFDIGNDGNGGAWKYVISVVVPDADDIDIRMRSGGSDQVALEEGSSLQAVFGPLGRSDCSPNPCSFTLGSNVGNRTLSVNALGRITGGAS